MNEIVCNSVKTFLGSGAAWKVSAFACSRQSSADALLCMLDLPLFCAYFPGALPMSGQHHCSPIPPRTNNGELEDQVLLDRSDHGHLFQSQNRGNDAPLRTRVLVPVYLRVSRISSSMKSKPFPSLFRSSFLTTEKV